MTFRKTDWRGCESHIKVDCLEIEGNKKRKCIVTYITNHSMYTAAGSKRTNKEVVRNFTAMKGSSQCRLVLPVEESNRFWRRQAIIGLGSALVVRHKLTNPPELPQKTVNGFNITFSVERIIILATYKDVYIYIYIWMLIGSFYWRTITIWPNYIIYRRVLYIVNFIVLMLITLTLLDEDLKL